jgi:hypothetical protein
MLFPSVSTIPNVYGSYIINVFTFVSRFTWAGHPWAIICDCFSEVMFGGRTDQQGEAASAHAIGMHGIVMLFWTQTTCGYLRKRKRITQNHCHYTETQSVLASAHETHLHNLETNHEVPFLAPNIILMKVKYNYFRNNVIAYKHHCVQMRKIGTDMITSMSFNSNNIHLELCITILYVDYCFLESDIV